MLNTYSHTHTDQWIEWTVQKYTLTFMVNLISTEVLRQLKGGKNGLFNKDAGKPGCPYAKREEGQGEGEKEEGAEEGSLGMYHVQRLAPN